MASTTEILFNSPALRSLRRDQLQRLCKIHAIKANGKNTDLIDRLKQHALSLPKDDPLSVAARSEQAEELDTLSSRPSEQWELLIDGAQEVAEMPSVEFGTRTPALRLTKSTTESSGLSKASGENEDELTQQSIPYSAIQPATPPLHDNFTFDPTTASHTRMSFDANGEPLPGCSVRPGEPAPDNARLSMGRATTPTQEQAQLTTTIRLVSKQASNDKLKLGSRMDTFRTPKLKAFATTFDLVMSPSAQADGPAFWAPDTHTGQIPNVYPTLTIDDLPPDLPPSPVKLGGDKANATNPSKLDTLAVPSAMAHTRTTSPDPFIFGSPRHSVSNNEFRAAATSVLEEMNKRLFDSGIESVGLDMVNKLEPGAHSQAQLREAKPLPSRLSAADVKGGAITQKFDHRHQAEFDKMEGIDGLVKRRTAAEKKASMPTKSVVGKKRKSNVLGELGDGNGKPRRPATAPSLGLDFGGSIGDRKTSGTTRVMSNGRRELILPGAFGDAEVEESNLETHDFGSAEDQDERRGKRARIDPDIDVAGIDATKGKAKAEDEDGMVEDNEGHHPEGEVKNPGDEKNWRESRQLDREREAKAIKRKLEMSRAKRRSSAGGVVAAARRKSSKPPASLAPKSKTSRFGFLASAKKLVASVWNRGKTPAPATSKPTTTTAPITRAEAPTKSSLLKRKDAAPGFAPTRVSAMTPAIATNTNTTEAPMDQGSASGAAKGHMSAPQSQEQKGTLGATGATGMNKSAKSRSAIPPLLAVNKPDSARSKTSKSLRMSSAPAGGSKESRVSSSSVAGTGSMGNKATAKPMRAHSFGSSRLLVPTASSLAKMRTSSPATNSSSSPVLHSSSIGQHNKKASLLGSITNSPNVRGGGIPARGLDAGFRKPFGAGILSPKMDATTMSGKIFSKPVTVHGVSGIPVKTFSKKTEGEDKEDVEMGNPSGGSGGDIPKTPGTLTRQRTFTRKPRISRSRVIARLASQRAASHSSFRPAMSGANSGLGPIPSTPLAKPGSRGAGATPRTNKRVRSSFAPVRSSGRSSFGGASSGIGLGKGSERDKLVLASAKKRVRQSEYARRRSRVSGIGGGD